MYIYSFSGKVPLSVVILALWTALGSDGWVFLDTPWHVYLDSGHLGSDVWVWLEILNGMFTLTAAILALTVGFGWRYSMACLP